MRYHVLATDYDGTLAHDGGLDEITVAALHRLRAGGRRLVMVTGRELDDLQRVCPELGLFDLVVAENGGLLYRPADRSERVLGEPPPAAFVAALQDRGVAPLSVGRCIVATWEPHDAATLDVIRELGLELQIIFNKGAVMVLPSGVNKASGLRAALAELGVSTHNVVGVGDAENDHAFLSCCACAVAVANALPTLQERADWVTAGARGAGVVELIDMLLADDLAALEPRLQRHHLLLGARPDGEPQGLPPYGVNLLISGSSGSGKSTFATALLDQMAERELQFCIVDPEGDYESYERAAHLGGPRHAPSVDEILDLLSEPAQSVVVNLLGVSLERRPAFFDELMPRLLELRARVGRPHWVAVDEAHHMLHADRGGGAFQLSLQATGVLYITVHPDLMAPAVLAGVQQLVAAGEAPHEMLRAFSRAVGEEPPPPVAGEEPLAAGQLLKLAQGEVLFWDRASRAAPQRLQAAQPTSAHHRHIRKYAEGDMKHDSFVFRGPAGKLQLRAQNLMLFAQIADGVDDETWLYHLGLGDYSRWFAEAVKDPELAAEAAQVEADRSLDPRASRARIREAIERRYTAPIS
jgi:hydroxymethylpyrimidine pyrophosphatase-like HAD family hydrolase